MKRESPQEISFYRQLGKNIQKSRKSRGLSQERLANMVGLTRTSLTNIEKGRQRVTLYTLCDIIEQLKIEYLELIPKRTPIREPSDLKALAKEQVRGENELAFIENAIREEETYGAAKTKNSDDSGKASGRK